MQNYWTHGDYYQAGVTLADAFVNLSGGPVSKKTDFTDEDSEEWNIFKAYKDAQKARELLKPQQAAGFVGGLIYSVSGGQMNFDNLADCITDLDKLNERFEDVH